MEARAQAEASNEPRSLSSSSQRSMKRASGKLHSQDTHNSGNTEGGGNDPRNKFALARYVSGFTRELVDGVNRGVGDLGLNLGRRTTLKVPV